mgnify:CR=1 FL=1
MLTRSDGVHVAASILVRLRFGLDAVRREEREMICSAPRSQRTMSGSGKLVENLLTWNWSLSFVAIRKLYPQGVD